MKEWETAGAKGRRGNTRISYLSYRWLIPSLASSYKLISIPWGVQGCNKGLEGRRPQNGDRWQETVL